FLRYLFPSGIVTTDFGDVCTHDSRSARWWIVQARTRNIAARTRSATALHPDAPKRRILAGDRRLVAPGYYSNLRQGRFGCDSFDCASLAGRQPMRDLREA